MNRKTKYPQIRVYWQSLAGKEWFTNISFNGNEDLLEWFREHRNPYGNLSRSLISIIQDRLGADIEGLTLRGETSMLAKEQGMSMQKLIIRWMREEMEGKNAK